MTKREKNLFINAYSAWNKHGQGYDIKKAYSRPSYKKREIWNSLSWLYRDLRVTSHNCQTFSCAGYDKQGLFTVITPSHEYKITRQRLACILLEG